MKRFQDFRGLDRADRGAAVAMGNFDGVHLGHQSVLALAHAAAAELEAPFGVVTFEPHPRSFFAPGAPAFRLMTADPRARRLEMLGIEVLYELPFGPELAGMSPEAFAREVLADGLGVRHVVVGADFRFGKGRAGDPETLKRAGAASGFGVTIVPQLAEGGEVFSSGAIRAELGQGDVKGAAQMLGWWWRVVGEVRGGAKRGTGMGYPTANVAMTPGTALAHGIYAVRVHFNGEHHAGAAYLGTRPTFDDGAPLLEVFLLDFDGNLYGRQIEVEFIDFIRGDRRFDGMEALIAQMALDCDAARKILATAPAKPF
jgi:riboflavin kinase/FMN adenylyltransferase